MRTLLSVFLFPALALGAAHRTGLREPLGWRLRATFDGSKREVESVRLPAAFDWRKKARLPDIKDQGQCGDCWAFAETFALEAATSIFLKREAWLSEEQLLSCNTQGYGCDGGWFDAMGYQVDHGQTNEASFPYTAVQQTCPTTPFRIYGKAKSWTYVGDPNGTPTVNQLKAAIYLHGPVAATINATNAFMGYTGGVFSTCEAGQINHAINIVGWNDNGGYWIVRNQWGKGWGMRGYAYVKYGCNSIGSTATYDIVK